MSVKYDEHYVVLSSDQPFYCVLLALMLVVAMVQEHSPAGEQFNLIMVILKFLILYWVFLNSSYNKVSTIYYLQTRVMRSMEPIMNKFQ